MVFRQCQRGAERACSRRRWVGNADGQVGAYPGCANEHQVLALIDKIEIQQGVDLPLGDGGFVAVVECFQS